MKRILTTSLLATLAMSGAAVAADFASVSSTSPLAPMSLTLGMKGISATVDKNEKLFVETDRYEFGYGTAERHENFAIKGALAEGYSPLGWHKSAVSFHVKNDRTFHYGGSYGAEDGGMSIWAGKNFDLNGWDATATVGYANADNTAFGYDVKTPPGGFPADNSDGEVVKGRSQAYFLSAGLSKEINGNLKVGFDTTVAKGSFKNFDNSIDGDNTMASGRAHVETSLYDRSTTTVSVGTPLIARSGDKAVVNYNKYTMKQPIDLGLQHKIEVNKNMTVTVGAASRFDSGADKTWATASVAYRF